MNSNVVSLRAGSPDPLAELFAERERLDAELARLAVVDARLAAAEGRLAEVNQGLSALSRADAEQMSRWADSAESEPPAPLLAERRALLGRQLDLQAEADAARVAVDAVAARRVGLIHAMNSVGARIRERQVAAAVEKARALHGEVEKLAEEIGQKMMRVEALRQVLTETLAEAVNRRDDAQAAIFRAALADVETMRAPQVLADLRTVARFAAECKETLR